jgi:heterodisulfide reductase subunit A-like polyferredoxin
MKGALVIQMANKDLDESGVTKEELMVLAANILARSLSTHVKGILNVGFDPDMILDEDPPPMKARTPREWN